MTDRFSVTADSVLKAAQVVSKGGVIIYPTETSYGIGGNALNRAVINNVYEYKERPRNKGLTVIVGSLGMAEQYCYLNETERAICEQLMPGPVTLVAARKRRVPRALNDKFVFRIPGYEPARRIAAEAGVPLIATSANKSGEPAAYSVDELDDFLLDSVDLVLDGGRLEQRPASTIVAVKADGIHIHREGPVSRAEIEAVVNG